MQLENSDWDPVKPRTKPFPFRESSFLDNPKVPEKIKTSRAEVLICASDDADCHGDSTKTQINAGSVESVTGSLSGLSDKSIISLHHVSNVGLHENEVRVAIELRQIYYRRYFFFSSPSH